MKTRKGKISHETQIERKLMVSRFPPRPIPKEVLKRTIKIVNNTNDDFWLNKNSSCAPPISYEDSIVVQHSDAHKKLDLARKCLLTRDFKNLAKLLTSNLVGDSVTKKSSVSIFSEYFTILLGFEDQELLKKLQQTMTQSPLNPESKTDDNHD